MEEICITAENKAEVETLYNSVKSFLRLKFHSYYKYSFTFAGAYNNDHITNRKVKLDVEILCSYGGCAEDIYKYYVSEEAEINLPDFSDFLRCYNYIEITDNVTNKKYSFLAMY